MKVSKYLDPIVIKVADDYMHMTRCANCKAQGFLPETEDFCPFCNIILNLKNNVNRPK